MPDRPSAFLSIRKNHPKLANAVEELGKATKLEGPLDEKYAQLIQIAASASIRSEGAMHSHVKRALQAGAEAAEIRHAILLLTSTIGFPSVVAALSWANDILGSEP